MTIRRKSLESPGAPEHGRARNLRRGTGGDRGKIGPDWDPSGVAFLQPR